MQIIEAQTEKPQRRQRPADTHDSPVEIAIEQSAHEERKLQRHERLEAADEPDSRIRRAQQQVLVVVFEKSPEAHDQAPKALCVHPLASAFVPPPTSHLELFILSSLYTADVVVVVAMNAPREKKGKSHTYQLFAIPQKPDNRAA